MGDDTKIPKYEFPALDNRAWTTPNERTGQAFNPKTATSFYEERGAFNGMLDRETGAQLVKDVSRDNLYMVHLLEDILGELKAHTMILNHLAGTQVEGDGLEPSRI